MKACRQEDRFCGHFSRYFPAVFESLQATIVSEALLAPLSPSGKIPFPAESSHFEPGIFPSRSDRPFVPGIPLLVLGPFGLCGSLAELATAVSARFELPQRDVLHLLRSEFRKVRAAVPEGEGGGSENIPRHGDQLAARRQFRVA
jgi:hypothetical protein